MAFRARPSAADAPGAQALAAECLTGTVRPEEKREVNLFSSLSKVILTYMVVGKMKVNQNQIGISFLLPLLSQQFC